jgi:hypothetical protein
MDSVFSCSTVAMVAHAVLFPHFSGGRRLPIPALIPTNLLLFLSARSHLSWRVMNFIVSLRASASYIRPTKSVLLFQFLFLPIALTGSVACSFIPKHKSPSPARSWLLCARPTAHLFLLGISLVCVAGLSGYIWFRAWVERLMLVIFPNTLLFPFKIRDVYFFPLCSRAVNNMFVCFSRFWAAMLCRYPTLSSLLVFELGDEDCERAMAAHEPRHECNISSLLTVIPMSE